LPIFAALGSRRSVHVWLLHGTPLCLGIGLYLGVLRRRPVQGALAGAGESTPVLVSVLRSDDSGSITQAAAV
jgi:hypothetical protein